MRAQTTRGFDLFGAVVGVVLAVFGVTGLTNAFFVGRLVPEVPFYWLVAIFGICLAHYSIRERGGRRR